MNSNELSLHIRIPAEKSYLSNVMVTLDGVCDHFCYTEGSRDKVKKALTSALEGSIKSIYERFSGGFDLTFTVSDNEINVKAEDFVSNSEFDVKAIYEDVVKKVLKPLERLTDGLTISDMVEKKLCYNMRFEVSTIQENNKIYS